jgi:hypothetical protein
MKEITSIKVNNKKIDKWKILEDNTLCLLVEMDLTYLYSFDEIESNIWCFDVEVEIDGNIIRHKMAIKAINPKEDKFLVIKIPSEIFDWNLTK